MPSSSSILTAAPISILSTPADSQDHLSVSVGTNHTTPTHIPFEASQIDFDFEKTTTTECTTTHDDNVIAVAPCSRDRASTVRSVRSVRSPVRSHNHSVASAANSMAARATNMRATMVAAAAHVHTLFMATGLTLAPQGASMSVQDLLQCNPRRNPPSQTSVSTTTVAPVANGLQGNPCLLGNSLPLQHSSFASSNQTFQQHTQLSHLNATAIANPPPVGDATTSAATTTTATAAAAAAAAARATNEEGNNVAQIRNSYSEKWSQTNILHAQATTSTPVANPAKACESAEEDAALRAEREYYVALCKARAQLAGRIRHMLRQTRREVDKNGRLEKAVASAIASKKKNVERKHHQHHEEVVAAVALKAAQVDVGEGSFRGGCVDGQRDDWQRNGDCDEEEDVLYSSPVSNEMVLGVATTSGKTAAIHAEKTMPTPMQETQEDDFTQGNGVPEKAYVVGV